MDNLLKSKIMKVSKNGMAKLEAGEVRVANFFFKKEKGHIKVQDINSMFSFRVSTSLSVGMWLMAALKRKDEDTLHIYAATMMTLLMCVPDDDYIKDVGDAVNAAIHRHPDYYGVDATEKSDAEQEEIVEGEKEKAEFVEQVKEMEKDA